MPDNPGLESSGDGEKKKENGTSGLSLASHQAQEGGSVDLLGLGNGPSVTENGGSGGTVDNIKKFYIKNNGVLYENDVVQVVDGHLINSEVFSHTSSDLDWSKDRN